MSRASLITGAPESLDMGRTASRHIFFSFKSPIAATHRTLSGDMNPRVIISMFDYAVRVLTTTQNFGEIRGVLFWL